MDPRDSIIPERSRRRAARRRATTLEKAIRTPAGIVQQRCGAPGRAASAGRSDIGDAVPAKLSRKIRAGQGGEPRDEEDPAASSRGTAPSPNKSRAYRGGDSESDDDDDDDDFGDGSMVVRQATSSRPRYFGADEATLAQFMRGSPTSVDSW